MRYARLLPTVPLLFVGCLTAGCVNDELGLTITRFMALSPSNMCVADPMASTVSVTRGLLDVGMVLSGAQNGYILAPVLMNNLAVNPSTGSPVNTITVTGFDVQLVADPNDPALQAVVPPGMPPFHIPAAGGQIMPAGQVGVPIEVVGPDLAKAIAPALSSGAGSTDPLPIMVRVRGVGTHAGVDISGGFEGFPLYVCKYCLQPPPGPCPQTGFPKASVVVTCFPQQDTFETCCIDSASRLVCGSSVPVSM
jgi:hypothetical protein